MEEEQVAELVGITERMLPDARNVYMVTDPRQILEISAQLREDLRHLRRLVENARAKVNAAQRIVDGSASETALPPISTTQAVHEAARIAPLLASATSTVSPAGSAAASARYPFTLPPYPPSVQAETTTGMLNQHHHLYPLALAMQNLPLPNPHSGSPPSAGGSDKAPETNVIVIDD